MEYRNLQKLHKIKIPKIYSQTINKYYKQHINYQIIKQRQNPFIIIYNKPHHPTIPNPNTTMLSQADKLTQLGISKMYESQAQNQSIIVQVYEINKTKNGMIVFNISDGEYHAKAYLTDDSVIKPGVDQFSIVCIKGHAIFKNNIAISDLVLVTKYSEKLGVPADWTSCKQNATQVKQSQKPKQFKFRNQKLMKTQSKKSQINTEMQMANAQTAAKASSGDSSYQLIQDLHFGLSRWTLLCRITSLKFKQTAKKGTKILEIQLVDKSKKRIIGTFFNQAAVDFSSYLKQGSIYQISKGRLVEGNYNNSKNQKISPYSLVFDSKSQFNQVSDVNIIAKVEDSALTLGKVYQKRILNQQFDVVGYVVSIKQDTNYQKDDKTYTVKQLVLADPQAKITMNARLWRWPQQFKNDMIGKVLIFSRFVLNQYKGSINLNSGLRSSITINHNHPMKKYQNTSIDVTAYTVTTQTRQRVQEDQSDFCYSTLDLSQRTRRMQEGQTIKSVLYVWVNRFLFHKKWNYQACPKCKKAAQKYSKCNNTNCGFAIQQTSINFAMRAQVSDFFGSIWITIYDELGKKVFNDLGNNAAKQLNKLQKDELGQKLQNYLYQPLRLKILTKKNDDGMIVHNANRIFQLNQEKVARENLKKIHMLMGNL